MPNIPWFDREETLSILEKRLNGFLAGYRKNIAVLGPEGIGKSTLIRRLLQQRADSCQSLIPLYVEIQEEENFSEWGARFIQVLLYNLLQASRFKTVSDSSDSEVLSTELPKLLKLCFSIAPETTASAQRLLALAEAGRAEEAYDRLWDLPYLMSQELDKSCLLVLDEFHRLGNLGIKDPFGRLGRKIMVQNMTMYLVVSSQPGIARSVLREGLSLLFGQFETLFVYPLHPAACIQALRDVLSRERGNPFLEQLLMELTQGIPAYLDLFLQGLVNCPGSKTESTDAERYLLDLLESLLLEPQGALRVRFEAQIRSLPAHQSRRSWMEVLMTVAAGHHRVLQISELTHRFSSQVLRALKVLEGAGLVEKQGVFYRLHDRLFQLWILTAYPVLRGIDLTDPAHARIRFRDASWAWMARIHEANTRSMEEHGVALLRQWGGELVEIEGRRIYLPRFKRVELIKTPTGRSAIVAHRDDRKGKGWLVIPWRGVLEEGEAGSLVKEVLNLPSQDYRKVIFGAHPVEVNARLVFQEARIRFWDLAVFNNLLDLYGLVRIPFPEESRRGSFESVPIGPGTVQPQFPSGLSQAT